jgi:hypothetical protein
MTDRKNYAAQFPSIDEMNAIEVAAHRARARQMKRMFLAGVRALKSLAVRLAAVSAGKRVSHA